MGKLAAIPQMYIAFLHQSLGSMVRMVVAHAFVLLTMDRSSGNRTPVWRTFI